MAKNRAVRIAGLGKYLPPRIVTSAEIEARIGLETGWIERKTGVRERRHVTDETTSFLGAQAARAALEDANAKLSDVDLVIVAAACPEQAIPCSAVFVQRQLGPALAGVPCFDLNATCLSFVYALDVAASFVASGAYRGVLLVSPEISSPSIDWTQQESSVLLGDGAGAVFLTRAAESESSAMSPGRFATWSDGAELAQVLGGGSKHHPNAPTTTPAMNRFHMEGPRIFKFTQKHTLPFVTRYFADLGLAASDFAALVPHQASLVALRMAARAAGFEEQQVIENIQDHGNCVAASIPMALHDGVRSGRIRRGERVLLAGTAAGVSLGALALVF